MKYLLISFVSLALAACGEAPKEISYVPEVGSVTQGGLVYYNLNCPESSLEFCNATAVNFCNDLDRHVKVTNHFVSGSQVKRLTFYCTTGRQQLVPENITFDSGSVVR